LLKNKIALVLDFLFKTKKTKQVSIKTQILLQI